MLAFWFDDVTVVQKTRAADPGLALAQDAELPRMGRVLLLYMPLMHAESMALQHECFTRLAELHCGDPPELQRSLDGTAGAPNGPSRLKRQPPGLALSEASVQSLGCCHPVAPGTGAHRQPTDHGSIANHLAVNRARPKPVRPAAAQPLSTK